MNREVLVNLTRVVLLLLFQVLILKGINLETSSSRYINIIIYQLGVILLPVATPNFITLVIAFVTGVIVDSFYGSIGVHTSACLWMAAARPLFLKYFEPKSGYTINQKPSSESLGLIWFMKFSGSLTFIYLLFYFILDVFTFVYFGQILLKTIASFTVSIAIIFLIQILINPKE